MPLISFVIIRNLSIFNYPNRLHIRPKKEPFKFGAYSTRITWIDSKAKQFKILPSSGQLQAMIERFAYAISTKWPIEASENVL